MKDIKNKIVDVMISGLDKQKIKFELQLEMASKRLHSIRFALEDDDYRYYEDKISYSYKDLKTAQKKVDRLTDKLSDVNFQLNELNSLQPKDKGLTGRKLFDEAHTYGLDDLENFK